METHYWEFQKLAMNEHIRPLLTALILHDWENGLHNLRVGALIHYHMIASQQSQEMIVMACIAGLGHDVGKIGSPSTLLSRPGKLTEDEKILLRDHVVHGLRLLENNALFTLEMMESIEQHHAWRKTHPYPYGKLLVEPVSLSDMFGQTLTVCDMYDRVAVGSCFAPPAKESFIERKIYEEFTGLPSVVSTLMGVHRSHSSSMISFPQKVDAEARMVAKLLLPKNAEEHAYAMNVLDGYRKIILDLEKKSSNR